MRMMDTKRAKRMHYNLTSMNPAKLTCSIIQDCEDALTNWVSANAAVSSKLSTRARTLSQRRHQNRGQRNQGEGVDLASQDQPMSGKDRESGLWVPAGAHREYQDDDEEEEDEEEVAHGSQANGESRGREEERATEA